jgi:SOS response regulatory protein OraA/RecX
MAITAIEPVAADPTMRRIKAGRRTLGTIHADEIESLGLQVGFTWTPAMARHVEALTIKRAARREAMRMLGRRDSSERAMLDQLIRRGTPGAEAAEVVRELVRDGWIDDLALAERVAQAVARAPGATAPLIESKLARRRISGSSARRIARSALEHSTPLQQAIAWGLRHTRDSTRQSPAKTARRIAAGLARRGFDADTIAAALDQLNLSADDPRLTREGD